ncbi:MAG: lysophospholipid acyltransferase family protein [Proteobacteria bacterium]|nr:lysophospholipid acyltransferase family protein [Pseudomonadota bacterium]
MIRRIRCGGRLARVGVHVVFGWCLATACYPFLTQTAQRRLQQRWSRDLLDMLGVGLEVSGPASLVASSDNSIHGLMVANHVSWLDVFVISSLAPATFVCKSEVRRWPLIGSLCAKTGTVFLERGSKFAAQRTHQALAGKLRHGDRVAIFPEGTTGEGRTLLPFRAALMQSAIDAGTPVQPLAIRYLDARGDHAAAANYCGETSFWQSLCSVASAPAMTASIAILEPVATVSITRKDLAGKAHASIRLSLEQLAIRPGNVVQDEHRIEEGELILIGE